MEGALNIDIGVILGVIEAEQEGVHELTLAGVEEDFTLGHALGRAAMRDVSVQIGNQFSG